MKINLSGPHGWFKSNGVNYYYGTTHKDNIFISAESLKFKINDVDIEVDYWQHPMLSKAQMITTTIKTRYWLFFTKDKEEYKGDDTSGLPYPLRDHVEVALKALLAYKEEIEGLEAYKRELKQKRLLNQL
jgi:hypothetical protein